MKVVIKEFQKKDRGESLEDSEFINHMSHLDEEDCDQHHDTQVMTTVTDFKE